MAHSSRVYNGGSQSSDDLLRKTFDVAGMTFPWVNKWRDRSATEIEIRHAVLNNPHAKMRSFFYFRDPTSVQICGSGGDEEKNSGTESKDNTSIFAPESAHAKALQDSLKDSIRAIQSNDHKVVDGYRTLEDLGKTMYAQLKEAIDGYVHEQSLASVAAAVTNGTAVQKPTPLSSRDETELQVSNRNSAVGKSLRHAYAKNQNLFSE